MWGICILAVSSVPTAHYYHYTLKPQHVCYHVVSRTTSYNHIVFRTYRSEYTILEECERELYTYLYGIAKNLRCQIYRIGGMPADPL